ncbi:hypothetical protein J3R30DRAFT_32832 [Lentinula aciculospora]|uniref:Uncharacterized protein n=1 Tax=Lentinula aciculospora TaxID=153920 RepID=A0A9W9AVS5_9AGAR|nr:hypothetical protein J3R30DRAFT_32832 [Lentinula aciculospora]
MITACAFGTPTCKLTTYRALCRCYFGLSPSTRPSCLVAYSLLPSDFLFSSTVIGRSLNPICIFIGILSTAWFIQTSFFWLVRFGTIFNMYIIARVVYNIWSTR